MTNLAVQMKLVKQVGNHRRHLNLRTAVQTYVPSFSSSKFHTASGDVTAMVALMLALAKISKKNGKRRRHSAEGELSKLGPKKQSYLNRETRKKGLDKDQL
tara:strand:+ start:1567 stop:1869 length:303 start_codon:yes stop_codon:yes gene_type:complete